MDDADEGKRTSRLTAAMLRISKNLNEYSSLEELLGDYVSFLQQRGLRIWAKDSSEALAVRDRYKSDSSDRSDMSDRSDPYLIGTLSAEKAANTMICLIHQGSFLIGRQIRAQEKAFVNEGGFSERLYKMRKKTREY